MLVLDAGNVLFQSALAGDVPRQKARALFLLEQMDALGTRAMAVGARDLTLGPALRLTAQMVGTSSSGCLIRSARISRHWQQRSGPGRGWYQCY